MSKRILTLILSLSLLLSSLTSFTPVFAEEIIKDEAYYNNLITNLESNPSSMTVKDIENLIKDITFSDLLANEVKQGFINRIDLILYDLIYIYYDNEVDRLLSKPNSKELLESIIAIKDDIENSDLSSEDITTLVQKLLPKLRSVSFYVYETNFNQLKSMGVSRDKLDLILELKTDVTSDVYILDSNKNILLGQIEGLITTTVEGVYKKEITEYKSASKDLEILEELSVLKEEIVRSNLSNEKKSELLVELNSLTEAILTEVYDAAITKSKDNLSGLRALLDEISSSLLSPEKKAFYINKINGFVSSLVEADYVSLINDYMSREKSRALIIQLETLRTEISKSELSSEKKAELTNKINTHITTVTNTVYDQLVSEYLKMPITVDLPNLLKQLKTEINSSVLTQEAKSRFISQIDSKLSLIEEDVLNARLSAYNRAAATPDLIKELQTFKTEIQNSNLWLSTKQLLLGKVEDLISKTKKTINGGVETVDAELIKKDMQLIMENGEVSVEFPFIGTVNYYNYTIKDKSTGKLIKYGDIDDGKVKLDVGEKITLEIIVSVVNKETKKETLSFVIEKSISDSQKPTLEYAYVKDGVVYVKYNDNFKMSSDKPLGYKLDGDTKFKYTTKGSFKVTIPEKVSIVLEDAFGNTDTFSFNIKADNTPLTKDFPDEGLKDLYGGKVTTFRKYNNVVVAEIDKKIDIFEFFGNLMKEFFKISDLSKIAIDDVDEEFEDQENPMFMIDLKKQGNNEFTIKYKRNDDLNLYIYVTDDQESNIVDITAKNKEPVEVEKIKLLDYISIELEGDNKKLDTSYLYVSIDRSNIVIPIATEIELEEDEVNEFVILDVLSGETFSIDIEHKSKVLTPEIPPTLPNNPNIPVYPGNSSVFTDVKATNWAYSYIIDLQSKGYIAGYPDGSFKPNNNITVREFNNILSKHIDALDNSKVKSIAQDITLEIGASDWGYNESKNVLSRINVDKIKLFNKSNLDRPITRGEVAFLVANTLNIPFTSFKTSLKDISGTSFYQEIQVLNNAGIIKGYPDATYKPANNITRAEIASIFANLD